MFAAAQLRTIIVTFRQNDIWLVYILTKCEGVEAAIYKLFNERICMTNQINPMSKTHGMYSAPNKKLNRLYYQTNFNHRLTNCDLSHNFFQ